MMGLMNYINSNIEIPLYAMAFSTMDELEEYLKDKALDILVVPEGFEEVHFPRNKMIYLFREKGNPYIDTAHSKHLFKYVKASVVVDAIMESLGSIDRKSRKIFKTYGVISPIGRCGKTNLAKSICRLDEVRGGLYIGINPFEYYEENEMDVLSHIFYMVKNRDEGIVEFMNSEVKKINGVAEIKATRYFEDYGNIDEMDMSWLFDRIERGGSYTTLVMDIDAVLLNSVELLEAFDILIMPVLDDVASEKKKMAFLNRLEREGYGKLAGKIKEVRVPDAEMDSQEITRIAWEVMEDA